MKKVEAYETTDGQIYLDEFEASEHEARVLLEEELKAFADKIHFRSMSNEELASELFVHRADLFEILATYEDQK